MKAMVNWWFGKNHNSAHGKLMWIGGLGPGGLDSDWIPENERDWDS